MRRNAISFIKMRKLKKKKTTENARIYLMFYLDLAEVFQIFKITHIYDLEKKLQIIIFTTSYTFTTI